MTLAASSGASASNSALQDQIDKLANNQALKSNADIAKDFAAAYHNYAKNATLLGAAMTAGGTLSILESAFVSNNTSAVIAQLAQGICNYWSSFALPGAPAHGGTSVVSVVVNGAAVVAAMTVAIQGVITDVATPDGWLNFYQQTEAVVKTIPCVITEMIPGSPPVPTPFAETIT